MLGREVASSHTTLRASTNWRVGPTLLFTALIAGVTEEERKVPCVISGKEGILASVKFSDFTSKYKQVVEMTA